MSLDKLNSAVETLESLLPFFRHLKTDAQTGNVSQTARTLKRLRGAVKRLQSARVATFKFCCAFDSEISMLRYGLSGSTPNFRRDHGHDSRTVRTCADMSTVDVERMRNVNALVNRHNEAMRVIAPVASDVETLTDTLFATFVDVKKRKALAYGYADVVGAARAFFAEKRGTEKSKFNFVLGSTCDVYDEFGAFPAVYPMLRVTRKPTAQTGERALYDMRKRSTYGSDDCRAARLSRVSRTVSRKYPMLKHKEVLALIPHYNRIDPVALRWANSRCNQHNVDTYPTTRPVEVARTERGEVVYRFEAITVSWHTVNPSAEVFFVAYPTDTPETKFDVYHRDNEKLDDIMHALERRHQRNLEALERNRLARLTDRQNKARVLRNCRNVETLTLEDSYRAGNCRPGTFQFCETLGINVNETPTLTGKEVAKRWRAADYVQLSMFERVLSRN